MHKVCLSQGIQWLHLSLVVDMLYITYVEFLQHSVYQKQFKSLDF